MRSLILLLLCASWFSTFAQQRIYREYDFSKLNLKSLDERDIGVQFDSVWYASGADSLARLAAHVRQVSYRPTYSGFEFGYEMSTASLPTLNDGLAALGFEMIPENFGAVVWGFNVRSPRWLYNVTFTIGASNKSSNDDYKLKVSATNIDLGIGYDIINHPKFQLYPQAALGFQGSWIEATPRQKLTPGDLGGWLSQGGERELNRGSLLLTYGVEADYHLVYSSGGSGIILGVRYGLTSDIIEGKWKMNGEKWDYDSEDRMKEARWVFLMRFYFK